MMKRWQYVYFAALFFFVCFFVSNKAFVSQTQNLCQLLMWGFEDGNCRRGRGVGGEGRGGGGDWTSWRAGLFSCLSPCSHSILISPLDLILPWGGACLCWHKFYSTDHISMIIYLIFARGMEIFTTAYAVVGSWIWSQNVLKILFIVPETAVKWRSSDGVWVLLCEGFVTGY